MATEHQGRRIAQICVYGVLSVVLGLMVATGPLGQWVIDATKQEDVEAQQVPPPYIAPAFAPPMGRNVRLEPGHDRNASMPAYQDARDHLRQLDKARTRLLHVASENDPDQLQAAGAEYQQLLHGFRGALSRLRDRVEPAAYPSLVGRLMMERPMSRSSNFELVLPDGWTAGPFREPPQ
ncbi:MAG: hypothetical protein MUF25_21035 [Pirellulaceae bacterium]|nr:hypothetical protein [Pirellulaceae bacterium]